MVAEMIKGANIYVAIFMLRIGAGYILTTVNLSADTWHSLLL